MLCRAGWSLVPQVTDLQGDVARLSDDLGRSQKLAESTEEALRCGNVILGAHSCVWGQGKGKGQCRGCGLVHRRKEER